MQTKEQYNQLFTMHGTIMLLMFATPLFAGFANVLMPLQIGAPDVAFPRLNALRLLALPLRLAHRGRRLPHPAGRRLLRLVRLRAAVEHDVLARARRQPVGLRPRLSGFGTILGAVNFITTIITMRAPGMTMFRMPIFTWNTLVTSHPRADGVPGARRRAVRRSAPTGCSARTSSTRRTAARILWQHLFWFFGHPEVYIIALPFFGIISEVFPVFSRKPIFGYKTLVYATIAIAALSVTVWAHHMYVTGSVLLPFFSLMTMLIAVPTGVKIFNWIGTMWRGSVTFETPMLWAIGFLVTFIFGGLTGVILASPPLDFHVSDTLLRRRALPLRGVRHRRVRDVRRLLLLVAEVDRQDAQRAARQDPLLAAVHRLPHDVPHPALARRRWACPAATRPTSPRTASPG